MKKVLRFLCLTTVCLAFVSTGLGQITTEIGPGVVSNPGSINIFSAPGFASNLRLRVGGATLTGGGTVTLSGNNSGIDDASGTQTLTIGNQTIQGVGNIGRNTANFVNEFNGLVDANVDGETLFIDPAGSFINDGTLRASGGGILQLLDAGTVDFVNEDGTIEALNGSVVLLTTNARIEGGELITAGTGQFRVGVNQTATLEDLTLDGPLVGENLSNTIISDEIVSTSSIDIVSTTNGATDLVVAAGGATLTGGGTVTLSGINPRIVDATGTQTLTIVDHTIQGSGNIGFNTTDFVNQMDGLIDANVDGETLFIDPAGSFINDGTLRASGGGILELRDAGAVDFDNAGTIEALEDSEVLLTTSARIEGGLLRTTGNGQFRVGVNQTATIEDLTLNGPLMGDDLSRTIIADEIINTCLLYTSPSPRDS